MTAAWILAVPIAVICLGLWDVLRHERRARAWAEETHEGMEGDDA